MNNVEWKRIVNQHSKLIQVLRYEKSLDKTKIAERIGVSSPTLYKFYDELKRAGILNDDWIINKDFTSFLGISIGSCICKITFLDATFEQIDTDVFLVFKNKMRSLTSNDLVQICESDNEGFNYIFFKTPGEFGVLKKIIDVVLRAVIEMITEETLLLSGIGISCTGCIDESEQIIREAHNLPYLSDRRIEDLFFSDKKNFLKENDIGYYLIQNSKAAVIAEKNYIHSQESLYELRECKNIVAIYLEYGVGSGLIIDDRLFLGASGYAGEVGHIPIPQKIINTQDIQVNQTLVCSCGATECVDSFIRGYVFDHETFKDMDSEAIHQYLKRDENRARVLAQAIGYISNLMTAILNIDLIILTGKLYKSMDVLRQPYEEFLDTNILKYNRLDCRVHMSSLGTLSPAIGAAIYAYHMQCNVPIDWVY